jgi:hypothetical protein
LAQVDVSEVVLKPVVFFSDPFREEGDVLVLTEAYVYN